jgi:hypothetical protein
MNKIILKKIILKLEHNDIFYIFLQLLFLAFFFIFIFGVNSKNLFLPWHYDGDGLGTYQNVQNIKDSGWVTTNPRLNAPFSFQNYDFMVSLTDNIAFLFLKLVFLLSNNIWFSVNINYIFNCISISFISYFIMVNLKINRFISSAASLTFALLPYFFLRGIMHYTLSMYQFVPLCILLCIWVYNEDIFFILDRYFSKNIKNILALLFCLLIAENGNGYYPFFACFFLIITGLIKTEFKFTRKLFPAIFLVLFICIIFIINLIPYFLSIIEYGKNMEAGVRPSYQAEYYGLKITQLFMPLKSYGINSLNRIITEYNNGILINENSFAYLGLLGTIGCLILFIRIFINEQEKEKNKLIFLLSRLNIAGILLATIGGFSSLFALFVSSQLRAYNRISVFIAFICILSVSILLNNIFQKLNKKYQKILFLTVTVCIIFIGIIFQYPESIKNKFLPKDITDISSFSSDFEFISFIENKMPENAMIYQLPFDRYPEEGGYRHFIGTLHSKKLKWSYGAIRGRYPDYWHQKVASCPIEVKLKILSFVGFEGIYIKRSAYSEEEVSNLERSLSEILDSTFYYSNNRMLSFISMKNFNINIQALYNYEEIKIIKEEILKDIDWSVNSGGNNRSISIITLQRHINDVIKNELGFYEIFKDGILYGPYITLNAGNYNLLVDCDFDNSIGNQTLNISTNFGNNLLQTVPIYNGENHISFTLKEKYDNIEFVIENKNFPKIEVKNMLLVKSN